MLTLPVEGRDREKGRPVAALAPWVTDLEVWSPEMPVFPLARLDDSKSASLTGLNQGSPVNPTEVAVKNIVA